MLACLLVLALLQGSAALAPVPDTPYTEVISSRMTCKDGGASVGPWAVAPLQSAANRVAPLYDPAGFVISSEDGVWFVDLPVSRNWSTPGMTSADSAAYTVRSTVASPLCVSSSCVDYLIFSMLYCL